MQDLTRPNCRRSPRTLGLSASYVRWSPHWASDCDVTEVATRTAVWAGVDAATSSVGVRC
jgi:hypothetical protein